VGFVVTAVCKLWSLQISLFLKALAVDDAFSKLQLTLSHWKIEN
jgi:hypothetical protein